MKLSIIIPYDRYKQYLHDCLESVYEQRLNDYETLLVVNNKKEIDQDIKAYDINLKILEAGENSSALGGVEFSSMWNLLYMSADQLEWIKTNYSGLWSQMDTDFRGYLDDIIQYGETEAEIIESVKEQITGISFDSFRDSYVSLLSDLDSTNKDFADSFEEYLRKSILQSVIAKNYDTKIQELYDSWSKAGEDGVFSESEIDRLRAMQQSITDAMLAERDQ